MKQIVLIDGKNLAYRAHFTHQQLSWRGFPTGVLYGATSMIMSIATRMPEAAWVWVWDGDGKTWRHKMAAEFYKANRPVMHAKDNHTEQVHRQLPILKRFFAEAGFRSFEVPCLEADDLIGILTHTILEKKIADKVIIYSSDKDFYQFIGKKIQVLKGLKDGSLKWADPKEIEIEYGIPVEKWSEFRALMGDPSDNIPQIFAGVGPKTAAKLILDGIDPMSEKCHWKPQRIRGKEIDFREHWDKLRLNMLMSRIPTYWNYPPFDPKVKQELKVMIKNLKQSSFLRPEEIKEDSESFNMMTRFFVRYGMAELLARRSRFWQLP